MVLKTLKENSSLRTAGLRFSVITQHSREQYQPGIVSRCLRKCEGQTERNARRDQVAVVIKNMHTFMISIRSFLHLIETARQRRKEKRENLGDMVNKQDMVIEWSIKWIKNKYPHKCSWNSHQTGLILVNNNNKKTKITFTNFKIYNILKHTLIVISITY